MDRRIIDDPFAKREKYSEALTFLRSVTAGTPWDHLSQDGVVHADILMEMATQTGESTTFLRQQWLDPRAVANHARLVLEKLHLNEKNDPYFVLLLPRNASQSQIRKRWKDLMLIYHPDRDDGSFPESLESTKRINGAYSILKDTETRAEYDRRAFKHPYPATTARRMTFRSSNRRKVIAKLIIPAFVFICFVSLLIIFVRDRQPDILTYQPFDPDRSRPIATRAQDAPAQVDPMVDPQLQGTQEVSLTDQARNAEPEQRAGRDDGEERHSAGGISQSDVNLFVTRYIRFYEEGNLDGLMGLYSSEAITNDRLDLNAIRHAYEKNFEADRFTYALRDMQWQSREGFLALTGIYIIKRRTGDRSEPITGSVAWLLRREGGALKIVKADYNRH